MSRFASLKISMLMLQKLHDLNFPAQVMQGVEDMSFTRRSRLLIPDITESAVDKFDIRASVTLPISKLNEVFNTRSSELESEVSMLCAMREEIAVLSRIKARVTQQTFAPKDLPDILSSSASASMFFGKDIYQAILESPVLADAYQLKTSDITSNLEDIDDEEGEDVDLEDINIMEWGTHFGSLKFSDCEIQLYTDSLRSPQYRSLKNNELVLVKTYPGSYRVQEEPLSYSLLPEGDDKFKLECWYNVYFDLPSHFEVSTLTMNTESNINA